MKEIGSAIWMYNHYTNLAKSCWDLYPKIEDASYMFDYYSEIAETYRLAIMQHLY